MKLRAPAKVNLSLRILGKRPDGFHDLESLVTPISLADEVTVKTSIGQGVKVRCSDASLPQDDSNLAAVAARQFHSHTGIRFQVHIDIEKHIPAGAGLGGGSSDAATVLIALDSIFETNLGTAGLEEIAAKIGSDVPFFIRRRPSWMRGRGEVIETAELPKPLTLVLIKPPFGVDTGWAYKRWASASGLPGASTDPQQVAGIELFNDLEKPVFEKYVFLSLVKDWLREQPECAGAIMSGSGSTTFGICDDMRAAREVADRARAHFGEFMWITTCEAPA